MTMTVPAPVKPGAPDRPTDGHPPANGGGNGSGEGSAPRPGLPSRRNSIWPFLLDLGLVMALFGLIITGRFLIVIGGVLFLVALAGWLREARAEYRRLDD
jgi:hypothetical protein